MEDLPVDKPRSTNSPKPNWCCLMDNLPTQGSGDGPTPCQPTKLFQWLSDKNLPQLEDETPPTSFYEVLENAEIAFHCTQCDKLLVSLNAESLQRTIGTQTQMLKLIQAQTQTQAQSQSPKQSQEQPRQVLTPRRLFQQQTQTPSSSSSSTPTSTATATSARASAQPDHVSYRRPYATLLHDMWLLRQRSLWSLLKTLLLCISLLNGAYLLCRGICRLAILRRLLLSVKPLATPPPPPPPPPPPISVTSSLPTFLWGQLCRLARKLHII